MTINTLAKQFAWHTMDGQVLNLHQMSTSHIFNSMKMIYNHLAETHGYPTIWFQKKYSEYIMLAKSMPYEIVKTFALFLYEIEKRKDLPLKYSEPFNMIKSVIFTDANKKQHPILNLAQEQIN